MVMVSKKISKAESKPWSLRRLLGAVGALLFRKKKAKRKSAKTCDNLQDLLANLHGASYSGLDIGGTLSKFVFFKSEGPSSGGGAEVLSGHGTLYLEYFETWKLDKFLKSKSLSRAVQGSASSVGTTGGGARKYGRKLEAAGLKLLRIDELTSLVKGIDFLSRRAQNEIFTFPKGLFKGGVMQKPFTDNIWSREIDFLPQGPLPLTSNEDLYPYLIVNMGSGTSILKVDSSTEFSRVGGTSLGGSHFLALSRLFAKCKSFDQAIQLAMKGDSTKVDLLVGDIYGGNYAQVGLASTTIASSLGKIVRPEWKAAATKPNVLKSLLMSETNEIGHLACLYADQASVTRVLFTGGFCQGYKFVMQLLAVAVEFRSQGNIKAMFLRHSAHGGAIGALLNSLKAE